MSLVTYNGMRWLPGCLASLDSQEFADFDITIHDNGSWDASPSLLGEWAAGRTDVSLHLSPTNLGYPAAHNRAIRAARGEFVLLLNQDVELDPGFLAAVVAAFDAHPEAGSVQPRLRELAGPGQRLETLDTTGLLMGRDRRAVSRGQGQPDGTEHRQAGPVWGVDGPAPVYRMAALQQARLPRGDGTWEVLDEDFFLYKEDVDLAWRMRLLGWSAWYEPAALGWHGRGSGATGATSMLDIARTNRRVGSRVRRLSWRNQRLMQIKNEDLGSYLRDLPWIARREVMSLLFILWNDPGDLAAVIDLANSAPRSMRKRRVLWSRIQADRGSLHAQVR